MQEEEKYEETEEKPKEIKKKNNNGIIIAIIGVILILAFGYSMMKVITIAKSCDSDPLTYGANKIYEQSRGKLNPSCSCIFNNPNYADLLFNKDGMKVAEGFSTGRSYEPINFSNFNITK